MRYFANITTAEELKKEFRALSIKLHPDRNQGNDSEFKAMLSEYETALKNLGAWTKKEADHVAGLRRGTSVIFYGAGMNRTDYIVTAVNGEDIELVRLFSHDFKSLEDVQYFDEESDRTSRHKCGRYSHIEPLSKKFGIGFYWDDIDGKTYTDEEIKEAERVADNFDRWIKIKEENEAEEERRAQEEADRAEAAIIAQWSKILEKLPPRFQGKKGAEWNALTREERKAEDKAERKANSARLAAFKRNVKAMFNYYFPGVKVTVTNSSKCWCESSVISWVDGPTVEEVEAVETFDYFRACGWCAPNPYEDYGHRETRRTLAKFRELFGAFSDDTIKFERTFSEETEKAVTASIIEMIPDYEGKKFNDKIQTTDEQAQDVIKFFGFDFNEPWRKDMTEEENADYWKRNHEHSDERDHIRKIIAPSFQRWEGECYWQSIHELFVKYYRIAKAETANDSQTEAEAVQPENVAKGETLAEGDGVTLTASDKGAELTGNTYAHKAEIKALGARWYRLGQCWTIKADKIAEAVEMVNSWNESPRYDTAEELTDTAEAVDAEPVADVENETAEEVPTMSAEDLEALRRLKEENERKDKETAEAVARVALAFVDLCQMLADVAKAQQEETDRARKAEQEANEAKARKAARAKEVQTLREGIATLTAQLATMGEQLRKMSDRLAELTADSENEPTEPQTEAEAPQGATATGAQTLHPEESELLRYEFAKASRKAEEATDRNDHTESVIICGSALLTRYVSHICEKVAALLDELREIDRKHNDRGHILPEEQNRRYEIQAELIRLTVEEYGEDLAAVLWGAGTVQYYTKKAA